LGESFLIPVDSGQTNVVMQKRFDSPLLWTPEHPNLYQADISLNNGHVIHEITQKFGFRTIAVREKDGIYVNGVKVRLKGVNRHSFWPESGRTLNKDMSIRDVNTIKNMNMNAVRMSHYPPDEHFLEACDSLGLFVLDELAGWQDAYDTCVGEKLVKEMVIRDVNHPCIIFWNNGNEGGWNPKLDDDFAKWDIQKRSVLHPWSVFNGINTTHYQDYEKYKELSKGPDIVLPTEIWHGLYDGGHGAGLEDYWKMIQDKPLAAGCFLWVYADEGIVRSDKNGMIDVDGNHAPDGILGPFHEKEGSYYSIKQVFSPVHPIRDLSSVPVDGRIQVENRYFYTNLSECTFSARLERFSGPLDYDFGIKEKRDLQVRPVSCAPGDTSFIEIDLPEDYMNFDNLSVRALDPYQREIYTWTFPVKSPYEFRVATVKTGKGNINITENQGRIRVNVKDCEYIFDRQRGRLLSVKRKDNRISFKNGPRLVAGEERSAEVSYFAHKDSCVIKVNYNSGSFKSYQWTILPSTWLKLSYTFELYGYHDFMGITFSYPEDKVKRMTWLGRGPYHVWKNRTQGVTYNIWSKDFSHVVPGKVWNYPAFKGYHSGFNWMVLETKEGTLTTMTDTKELFLRMFTANSGENPAHAKAVFPSGDVSFLHGISPIGTKFRDAVNTGPRGKMYHNQNCFNGVLYFYFDTPEM
jgi:hypothetical protein